ncbi:MAG: Gfo/Idh/MocA family protein [Acidobacteriota bacterium]
MSRTRPETVIAGAGLMGRWHGVYARRLGACIKGIVDSNPKAARHLARKLGGSTVFTDLEECLLQTSAPIVHICTPAASHFDLARTALRAGRHGLMEKPFAADSGHSRALLRLAQERDLRISCVHQWPFQDGFRKLTMLRKRLGQLVALRYGLCSAGGAGLDPDQRLRLLFEILPHPFSLLYALLGQDTFRSHWRVAASSSDHLELNGRIGPLPVCLFLSLQARPTRNQLTLFGRDASCQLDLFHGFCRWSQAPVSRTSKLLNPFREATATLAGAGWNLVLRCGRREWAFPGLSPLIRAFYRSVDGVGEVPVGAEEIVGIAEWIDWLRSKMMQGGPESKEEGD